MPISAATCAIGLVRHRCTIYLIYTEGHTATTGDSLTRVDLSREAIRLGRVLTELMPDEPEAVGLLALMLLTEAWRPARTAIDGSMVRLADQDRTQWERILITEGHTLAPACAATSPARSRSKRPSPPPTPTPPPPQQPTGPRSSPSTTSSTPCAPTR
jgi:predicted RNA polymerase sigma factor